MLIACRPIANGRISSPFGPRAGGMHRGVDFAAPDGTPIYAAQAGVVAHIGPADGFGQWIVLDHAAAGGGTTVYGHMWDAHATGLHLGARVTAGQLIGYVGNNGRSSGPHLHFETHPGPWRAGSQTDPAPLLARAAEPPREEKPVPLPIYPGRMLWLEDILVAELGRDRVRTVPGWQARGHGDFRDCRGVMLHHTGNSRETADSIARGRKDLTGPLSQLHIAADGIVTVVAAGVAWHAGRGSLPWVPANMGNWYLIGVECAWPPVVGGRYDERAPWPAAQVIAMRDATAAILGHLRYRQDRLTMHKTYASAAQGKWDPGNMSLPWMQGEVGKDLDGALFPGERPEGARAAVTPLPVMRPVIAPAGAFADVLLFRGQPGQSRDDVEALQTVLRRWYSTLKVDGDFGEHTESAVADFQRVRGLLADGVVGPQTAAALDLHLARKAA